MGVRPSKEQDAALSLTLAVVASANSPLVLLDGELDVIAVSAAFCQAFGIDSGSAPGRKVFDLGAGEWDVPQFRSLLEAAVRGQAPPDMEFDLLRNGREARHLITHAERLLYLDLDQVRVLMAITDATDARNADKRAEDLRERNAMLVQEARHRVANSLQIIASVLMQHARKAQSKETSSQLKNAHQRVMSVAALERHLAGSGEEYIPIRSYLVTLCETIAASMIEDRARVSLEVAADDSTVDASTSVSLGLITTELVINAVKCAFPQGRAGKITVSYRADGGGGWVLAVSDDGVGFPPEAAVKAGLGTSIVQALATQLQAHAVIERKGVGATVSIVRPPPSGA